MSWSCIVCSTSDYRPVTMIAKTDKCGHTICESCFYDPQLDRCPTCRILKYKMEPNYGAMEILGNREYKRVEKKKDWEEEEEEEEESDEAPPKTGKPFPQKISSGIAVNPLNIIVSRDSVNPHVVNPPKRPFLESMYKTKRHYWRNFFVESCIVSLIIGTMFLFTYLFYVPRWTYTEGYCDVLSCETESVVCPPSFSSNDCFDTSFVLQLTQGDYNKKSFSLTNVYSLCGKYNVSSRAKCYYAKDYPDSISLTDDTNYYHVIWIVLVIIAVMIVWSIFTFYVCCKYYVDMDF